MADVESVISEQSIQNVLRQAREDRSVNTICNASKAILQAACLKVRLEDTGTKKELAQRLKVQATECPHVACMI